MLTMIEWSDRLNTIVHEYGMGKNGNYELSNLCQFEKK